MKLSHVVESKQQLLEQHRRDGLVLLVESTQGLDKDQQRVVENVYKHFLPLIEASLSKEQVQQIFTGIEQGATAGGKNRTMLGKGKDVAVKANEIINNVGKWLQDTKPVQAFDQKFEKLKSDINKKFPDSKLLDKVSELAIWVEQNPGKSAAVIGILTAIAALATGPVGGAIAGQVLKGSAELLKGEKLSTAIGKGAKAAALGWLTGQAIDLIGKAISTPVQMIADKLNPDIMTADYTRTIREIGGEFGDRFGNFTTGPLAGRPEDVKDIVSVYKDAVDSWKSGDYLRANSMFKSAADMTQKLSDPEYLAQIGAEQAQAQSWSDAASGTAEFFSKMGEVAQGAATGAASKEPKQESRFYNTRPLSEGQVYLLFNRIEQADEYLSEAGIMDKVKSVAGKVGQKLSTVGKNLTTKVTADKLSSAWQKAGAPTDSDELYSFLQQQGVSPEVIVPVYDTMKLPVPGDQEPEADAPQAQKLNPAKDSPTDTIGLQTQEPAQQQGQQPAQGAQRQAASGVTAAQTEPEAQDTKIDVIKLAQAIKAVQPDITGSVKKLLDADIAAQQPKKQQANPAAQSTTA